MEPQKKICISLCMGSSCSARGNHQHLQIIRDYLADNQLTDKAELIGSLCEGKCTQGPNIRINDHLFTNIDPNSLLDILDHHFKKE